jgi:hypothetical protein
VFPGPDERAPAHQVLGHERIGVGAAEFPQRKFDIRLLGSIGIEADRDEDDIFPAGAKDILRWYHTGGNDACQQPLMRSEAADAYSELVNIYAQGDVETVTGPSDFAPFSVTASQRG